MNNSCTSILTFIVSSKRYYEYCGFIPKLKQLAAFCKVDKIKCLMLLIEKLDGCDKSNIL